MSDGAINPALLSDAPPSQNSQSDASVGTGVPAQAAPANQFPDSGTINPAQLSATPPPQTPQPMPADVAARHARSTQGKNIQPGQSSDLDSDVNHGADAFVSELGNMVKGIPSMIYHAIPGSDFFADVSQIPLEYRAYENARAQGKSPLEAMGEVAKAQQAKNDVIDSIGARLKEFKTDPSAATGKALADLVPMILTLGASAPEEAAVEGSTLAETGAEGAAEGAAPEAAAGTEGAEASETSTATPPTPSNPSIVQQVLKGKKVAQAPAESAVRSGIQASTEAAGTTDESVAANVENQPILQGNQTVVDEPLDALAEKKAAAYKAMDDVAGFDVKAEKAQLANDQYKLKQLGNTEADTTARENLTQSISDSQARIADAETKIQDAGIDPKAADNLNQQWKAGQDFKKTLVKNTNPDGSINVDGLLKDSKNLRFTKYGDRLQQFMGKDGAKQFMSQLQDAQKMGAHAMKAQKIATWIGGSLLGLGSEIGVFKALSE